MNLDEFVSETLKQIIKGVKSAQTFGATQGANINPISIPATSISETRSFCKYTGAPIQLVAFDVALTVSQESNSSTSQVSVGSISVPPAESSSIQNSSMSRIKFEIPVMFPTTGRVDTSNGRISFATTEDD